MDLDAFKTTGGLEAAEKRLRNRLPQPATGELFIKGPIPLSWLAKAAGLPGKSIHVALAAWFKCSVEGNGAVLPRKTLQMFHVDRNTGRRALRRLEAAGLLHVERHPGRAPIVTVIHGENNNE